MAHCRDEVRDECTTGGGGLIKVLARLRIREGAAGAVTVTLAVDGPAGTGSSLRRLTARRAVGAAAAIAGQVVDLATTCDPALAGGDFYFDVDLVGPDVLVYAWSVPKARWCARATFEGTVPSG